MSLNRNMQIKFARRADEIRPLLKKNDFSNLYCVFCGRKIENEFYYDPSIGMQSDFLFCSEDCIKEAFFNIDEFIIETEILNNREIWNRLQKGNA